MTESVYLSKLVKQGYKEVFGSAYRIRGKTFEKTLALAYFNKADIELRPCPINA